MFLRACAVLLAFAVVTLPAAAAQAAPPEPTRGVDSGTVFLTDCGSFDLLDQFVTEFQGKTRVARDGTVTIVEHVWGSDTFVNSVTGEMLTGTINAGEMVDLAAGTVTESGQIGRITVPGVGVLFFDVGKFVVTFDGQLLFRAGRHHAFLDEDYAALCEALG